MMLPDSNGKTKKIFGEYLYLNFKRNLQLTFRGIADNWRERIFYQDANIFHRLLLQATYFSFFGLFNIQRYGKPADRKDAHAIYRSFYLVAGQGLVEDSHHWTNAGNFHLASDGPKLLDYGSPETQKIVGDFGLALYTRFDIQYGRSEAEKYNKRQEERNKPLIN